MCFDEEESLKMMLNEVTYLSKLKHIEGVQQLVAVDIVENIIITKYAGPNLGTYLMNHVISNEQFRTLMLQLARIFEGLASCQVVHTDVKEDNICV